MSFTITYKFVGLNDKDASIINLSRGVDVNKKNIHVDLRDVVFPRATTTIIDPLVLDLITTEVHHSRSILDHAVSLETNLPAWITDYFTVNETKSLTRGRSGSVVLKLYVQLTTSELKYNSMVENVDFQEIKVRQKWILGKLFTPFSHFPVIDIYQFEPHGKSVISRPTRVGYFSIKICDGEGVFSTDKSQLRFFHPPSNFNDEFDLTTGFNPDALWCRSPIERHIVRWYWENGSNLHTCSTAPNIITDLRTLATIMASPTNNSENWEVVCCKFMDQIFMFEIDTIQRLKRVHGQTTFQNLSSYSGYRFEQLVTRRFDGRNCRIIDGGLRDSFYSVNETNIGKHKVLYSARCSAASNKENMIELIDDMDIVEIKTRTRLNSWESRAPALWARALLNRIDQIHIGEKNNDFMVTHVTTVPASQILPKGYNTSSLFNFLHKTLDFITDNCKVEKGVYRLNRTPFLPVIIQKLDAPIESVLPRWYVNGECPSPSVPFLTPF